MSHLNERLLVSPPFNLVQHRYKDEVINFIINKAFIELPLKEEWI